MWSMLKLNGCGDLKLEKIGPPQMPQVRICGTAGSVFWAAFRASF
jgi:hypothetical protein